MQVQVPRLYKQSINTEGKEMNDVVKEKLESFADVCEFFDLKIDTPTVFRLAARMVEKYKNER